MFQKKQIIYSETLGLCQVDNIVQLSASKDAPQMAYYVLRPIFNREKVSYIPVQNHQVVLREIFSQEEAKELMTQAAYREDANIKAAVDYILGITDDREEENGSAE